MIKKVLAGIGAAVLLAGVTACASKDKPADADDPKPSASSEPSKSKVSMKIMGNFASSNLSETDKLLVQSIEKATNTEIKFDIPPATGYTERLQLSLTTGDYPDVVWFPSPNDAAFLKALKDGVILPIDDYLKNAENIKKYSYDVSWDALRVNNDGKIYGIPRTTVIRSDGYWLRKDWLDKLNIKLPDNNEITLDQMIEIMRKFSKEDPDGNGKHDTYGFGTAAGVDKSMKPIFQNELGLYGWQKSSGGEYSYMNPQYDLSSDQYTKALELSAKLFKEGLIDPDSPSIDGTKTLERFQSGKTGAIDGFAGHYETFLNAGKKINPKFELAYVFVKNEQGEMKGLGQGTGLWGFWAITRNAKDPQRVVNVFDYMLSDKGWETIYTGVEGHDYKVENNKRTYVEPPLETFVRKNMVRRANDYMFFINPAMSEELKQKLVPNIEKAVKRIVMSKDRDFTPAIAKTPPYLDFNKKFSEVTTKIIIGDAQPSEYKKVLQDWNTKFGKTYLKEMNDYIAQMESKK
ncbi:putative aldouronate transport system substrate-binding protein [Paenibacillus sp. UNCCL117]|uniref:extracellular solute-binding protein n=1 Tax=unclassified Paenibacillus TaxID=185978 RepID=UPI00088BABF9|nr:MULTISPECIES: extracellular solute-binding protein [unclassified Paenibacillus]SDE25297.1 putative aldouronate transport system substrate-binding protein [Paenibacillus sp. cl123]SFW62393.1 putative aldouronate transport system substrate-binding protein [Paenibacillus sp. UNCCL117]